MGAPATQQRRDDLIAEYREFVHHIVGYLVRKMRLPVESFDEFVSAGYLGLVEAADRFDFSSNREFRSFAFLRIRGAIIDSIRECADLTGRAYRIARALNAAQSIREGYEELQATSPGDRLADILEFAARGALTYRLSMAEAAEEPISTDSGLDDPEAIALHRDQGRLLRRVVTKLPPRERLIVEEYYFKDKSFQQIARENPDLSKSWISRLHTRAVGRLLTLLKEEGEEFSGEPE